MPDSTDANNTTDTGNEAGDKGAATSDVKSAADLPKWAQDELSRARNEAAGYRTKLRDAETARNDLQKQYDAETAKVTGLTTDLSDAKLFGLKLDAALEVGVPGEHLKAFADRLRGDSADELKKDAETVKQTFGVGTATGGRAPDRSAGLGNDKPSTPDDLMASFVGGKLGWNQ